MARPGRSRTAVVRTAVVRTLAAVAVTGALVTATALPAHAAGGLTCRYTPTPWPGGFSADLVIYNNTTTTINGWTAFWTFQTATQVTNIWNGTITQATPFDATGHSALYNAVIHPGASSALGWTANAVAAEIPTEITVNGTRCPVG
jgi:Cellulose binding domain